MDLNLQFPANWEQAREIKFSQGYNKPAPRDYVGEGPLTAIEALNIFPQIYKSLTASLVPLFEAQNQLSSG